MTEEAIACTHVRQPADHPLCSSEERPPFLVSDDAVETSFPIASDPVLDEDLSDVDFFEVGLVLLLLTREDGRAEDVSLSHEDVGLPELERGREDLKSSFVQGSERLKSKPRGGSPVDV